jgi:hypothetical protein
MPSGGSGASTSSGDTRRDTSVGARCAAAPRPEPSARTCVSGKIVAFCRAVPPGRGFRLDRGAYTTIQAPRASLTVPWRINNRGQVVGAYVVPDGTPGGRTHGFLLDNGTFTTFDSPLATTATAGLDINDRRQIVGVIR